jgi:hypothetical protein
MILKVYEYLQDNNIDVYLVGQYKGECKSPYIVLKDDGITSSNRRVGKGYIDILFFIPENKFTKIKDFRKQVVDLLKEFKSIRYAGNETGIVTDNDKKALTFSIMYEKYMRLN